MNEIPSLKNKTSLDKYGKMSCLSKSGRQVDRCSIYKPSTLTACLFRLWQLNYLTSLNIIANKDLFDFNQKIVQELMAYHSLLDSSLAHSRLWLSLLTHIQTHVEILMVSTES